MVDKVRINIYLDEKLRNKAMEKARKMGLNFSAFVSLAIYEYVKKDLACQKSDNEVE